MVVLVGVIANRMSLTLKSRSTSIRTVAGERVDGAVGTIRDVEGCGSLAAVGVLGEFGPLRDTPTRGPGEDMRAVDAVERRGADYRLAAKLAELRLTLDSVLTHRRADVTLPACYSGEVLQKESRCKTCTRMNAIA
jgi:hypothetical protein